MPATPLLSLRSQLFLALILGILWFGSIHYRSLIKTDEGRYAEIAQEMVLSGDWTTPRLNGIKYFEKPPLQYWATAVAFKVFGFKEWAARLWPALTGFMGVLLLGFTARRLFGPTVGLYSSAVLASSLLYFGLSQFNTLDMGVSFFLEATLCCFLLAHFQPAASAREQRRWMLLCWASMGLAILSKGLIGMMLPGAVLTLYVLIERDWAVLKRMEWLRGLGLFLLITAPWFVAVSLANQEFAHFFFIHEHLERFLTTQHRRYRPWWYFIQIFALGILPWLGFMLHGAWQGWRQRSNAAPAQAKAKRFLLLWSVFIFIFFSVSSSKLPSYILPIFPAAALLLGLALERFSVRAWRWQLGILCLIAGAILAALIAQQPKEADPLMQQAFLAYRHWLYIALAAWFATFAACYFWLRKNRPQPAVLTLCIGTLLAGMIALLGHENIGRVRSAKLLSAQIKPLLEANTPFYTLESFDHTLPFYLQRPVTMVAVQDELEYGLKHEPQLWIPGFDEFSKRWNSDAAPFAIMPPDVFQRPEMKKLAMKIVYQDSLRVVVTKP